MFTNNIFKSDKCKIKRKEKRGRKVMAHHFSIKKCDFRYKKRKKTPEKWVAPCGFFPFVLQEIFGGQQKMALICLK